MNEFLVIGLAFAGGILPALAWLWFWQREDAAHPEPRHLIALAFFAGMLAVAAVIPIQKFAAQYLLIGTSALFVVWAAIEEIVKYIAARITVLRNRAVNEPLDPVMYMVTVALGFAAVENALFLLSPLTGGDIINSFITGNLRFIGATLLHVLSSSVIGIALAFSFYRSRRARRFAAVIGLILAIILHSGFNFLILNTKDEHLFRTFAVVWIGIVLVLAILEIIKRIRRK